MNATTTAFGTVLRQFREAAGLSQERLAERAGLSLRGISDLERGVRTTPRLETVRLLAEGLELDEQGAAELLASRNTTQVPAPEHVPVASRLPSPSTAFFGRGTEIEAISDMLLSAGNRLLTLVGPGGVGKTRLAVEVARRLQSSFPDGVVFAGLATVRDSALVLPTIATALGAPDTGAGDMLDLLEMTMRGRSVLLVIDNVEQVVEAAPEISSLLGRCPTLRTLATSRVVLNLTGERTVPILPLALPANAHGEEPEEVGRGDAVAMFVDRARTADPEFALTVDTVDAVVELVTRLDGLPLAIELAAARTNILPPNALLERMDRQLPLLTGGSRDVPERQQTMRNAIAWSYDLLPEKDQAIFRRLSIFRAGCTLEAAEKVLGTFDDLDQLDVLDGLKTLVESSLLRRRQPDGSPPRFVMLSTVREFGLEQLALHGEEEATREAVYRRWSLHLASQAEPHTAPKGEVDWLELLEHEHDNFRSTLSWLIEKERIQEALDLSGALWFFRWIRGHYAEARDQWEDLLRHPLGQARTEARARALSALGIVTLHQGDSERSRQALDEALGILRSGGDPRMLGMALIGSSNTYLRTGHLDEAEAETRECHEIAASIGARTLEGAALANLGILALKRGREDEARAILARQLELFRSIQDVWGQGYALLQLGRYSMQDGDLDRAQEQVEAAVSMLATLKNKRDLPAASRVLADIARLQGGLDKAESLLLQALDVAVGIGDRPMIAQCHAGMGRIALDRGDMANALRLAREAIQGYRDVGDDVSAAQTIQLVAEIAAASGDHARAAWLVGVSDRILEEHGAVRTESFPDEHGSFVESLTKALGEPGWRKHWAAGYREDVQVALDTGFALKSLTNADDVADPDEIDDLNDVPV